MRLPEVDKRLQRPALILAPGSNYFPVHLSEIVRNCQNQQREEMSRHFKILSSCSQYDPGAVIPLSQNPLFYLILNKSNLILL
jgi:hypothetical protein